MFTQQLPLEVFETQREFIRVFEPPLDFTFWAKLMKEEAGELEKAHSDEPIENILKELGDTIYVIAGFYNTMPLQPAQVLTEEKHKEIEEVFEHCCAVVSKVTNDRRIPLDIVVQAFILVHASNMTKLAEDGSVIRSDGSDGKPVGKVLKGPNYQEPDMKPLVTKLEEFHAAQIDKAIKGDTDA